MPFANARALIDRFKRMKTLVIGDVMLDHFIWGAVSRISPEAPVPVVQVTRENDMPGGAGNVAVNMAALGAEVYLVALVGGEEKDNENATARLIARLAQAHVRTDCLVRTRERPTIVKTRIIAQHQQVVRFDREEKALLSTEEQGGLLEQIERILPSVDAIVLSNYAKGVVSRSLIRKLIPLARRRGIPITVDPKMENFSHYQQVTCVTPNLQEAMQGAGMHSVRNVEDIERLGQKILKKLKADSLLITRGEAGMSLFEKNRAPVHIPTKAREVFDVTGAGDTVISTLTLALAAGSNLRHAAELANEAAGIVVGKLGTASVSGTELLKAVNNHHG